jgi:hypothetical protein
MKILMAMTLALLVGCDGEAYKQWSNWRERNAALSYGPFGELDWQYLDDGNVQYAPRSGTMFYRKVKSEEHVVIAYFDEEGFGASAFWKVDCSVGTKIETSQTFSGGSPKTLNCRRYSGSTWLDIGVHWADSDEPLRWAEDLDGFEVSEDFRDWDWSKAKQYATLQKASTPPTPNSLAASMKEEEPEPLGPVMKNNEEQEPLGPLRNKQNKQ